MILLIANIFGVLSTICFIISFQIKSNRALYLIQALANGLYGVQFCLLGARSGMFNMGLKVLRNLLLSRIDDWKWVQHWIWAPLFCLPSLIYMILTWEGPLSLLPFLAHTVGTFTFWTNSARLMRVAELACISPSWLIYDFCTGAYGGILTELVILASVVVSIIRFGWKGLEDPEFKK